MFSDRLHWRQRRLGFARQDDNPDWKEALQDHLPAVRQPLQTSLQIQFPGAQMSCAMSSRRLFNLPALQFFHSGKQGLCYWPPLEFWPSLLSENMYVSIHWESIGVWKNHTTISTKGHFWKSHTEKHRRDPQRIAHKPQAYTRAKQDLQTLKSLLIRLSRQTPHFRPVTLTVCCHYRRAELQHSLLSPQVGFILMGILLPQLKYKYLMA